LKLPKIQWVKYYKSLDLKGTPKYLTISITVNGIFVSIQTEWTEVETKTAESTMIGLDIGVKRFARFSDGSFIAPLNSFKRYERKLQRKLTRKKKKVLVKGKLENGGNWSKAKRKVKYFSDRAGRVCLGGLSAQGSPRKREPASRGWSGPLAPAPVGIPWL
jgi:putative transposase